MFNEVARGQRSQGIHLWRSEPALIVPRHFEKLPEFVSACKSLQDQGWPVVCRVTGGDAVPQTAGMLNIAIAFLISHHVGTNHISAYAYGRLCMPIVAELSRLGLQQIGLGAVAGAFCDGKYNITIAGRKVAGTAQRWRRCRRPDEKGYQFAVLAHAAVIVDAEVAHLVEMTNRFYRLCRVNRHCLVSSHSSLVMSFQQCGLNPPGDLHYLLAERLAVAYSDFAKMHVAK